MYPFYNYVTQQQNVCPEDTYDDSCMCLQGVFQRIKTKNIIIYVNACQPSVIFVMWNTKRAL